MRKNHYDVFWEAGIAAMTLVLVIAGVILVASAGWTAYRYFTDENPETVLMNENSAMQEVEQSPSVLGFFAYLAREWRPIQKAQANEIQGLEQYPYEREIGETFDLPAVPEEILVEMNAESEESSNVNGNLNVNEDGNTNISVNENLNGNENVNGPMNENANLNTNITGNENSNVSANENANENINENTNTNTNLNTNTAVNENTNIAVNLNTNTAANENVNAGANTNVVNNTNTTPSKNQGRKGAVITQEEWLAEMQGGRLFIDPEWYCAATGLTVTVNTDQAEKNLGRFHGDCTNPLVTVKGTFSPQQIGAIGAGTEPRFTFDADHYRLGDRLNYSDTPDFCHIDYFRGAGHSDIYAIQYTCDDGFYLGLHDDIQLTAYVLPPSWNIPANADELLAEFDKDSDGDSLTNERERELGTDPLKGDTDGDGFNDATEVQSGHDPLKP